MSDLTPEQYDRDRAEAQAISEVYHGCDTIAARGDDSARRWLAVRDYVLSAHECPTVPVWRPVTFNEIRAGWEIRSRYMGGHEATWGIARHRDLDGDWRTESNVLLTNDAAGWTYETTAPAPKPDPRIEVLAKELHKESGECREPWPCPVTADSYRERARRLLPIFDKLKNGEQS